MDEEKWFHTIRKVRDYSEEQYDKLIVYLNSGALVLTIGFTKDIVPDINSINTSPLKISWAFFIISLLLILFSHRTSIMAMNAELIEDNKTSNKWDKHTTSLNWSALFALILGVIIFTIFISVNI